MASQFCQWISALRARFLARSLFWPRDKEEPGFRLEGTFPRCAEPEEFSWKKVRPHPGPLPRGEGATLPALEYANRMVMLASGSKTRSLSPGERVRVRAFSQSN